MSVRSTAVRGGLAALALVVLWGAWYVTAEWWSLLVDRVYTAPMQAVPSTPFGWNGIYLQFGTAVPGFAGLTGFNDEGPLLGEHLLELDGPGPDYKQIATIAVDGNDKLILSANGRRFVLGVRAGTIQGGDGPVPAFAAEPGDETSLSLERSLLGWPLPPTLAGTYLSGAPTTWARHLYYRLSWQKASGARLTMVWRCEQGWERTNGWHNLGFDVLTKVEIAPAPS
jgi:hypothetical protein